MRFLLAFVLIFVSVFASAQPPMVLGGPQGIDVTRILARNWMSIPIYIDTPAAPLTGSGWPGKGYIIQVAKAGDTSVWQYTGQRWAKIAGASQETYTKLVTGGDVNQLGLSRQYTVSPSTYFINGVYYNLTTQQTVTSPVKTANANARIDVIALTTTGATVVQGTERPVPLKPSVGPNRLELAAIYYPAFDTVSREISEGGLTSVYRILGRDSIYFTSGDSVVAVKDSIGISKNDTAAMLNPYKFTAANGLTKDSTVFRLGGSLNQNTNINLNTRRLTFIGSSDTTRFFSNGRVSIGGVPDSTNTLNVNGNTRVNGILRLAATSPSNSAVIVNQNSTDGSLVWGANNLTLPSNFGARNVLISPSGTYSSLTGFENVLIGRTTGQSLTSGLRNTFVGNNAGSSITTGANNIFIGGSDGWGNVPSNTSNSIQIVGGLHESNRADTILLGLTSSYAFIGGGGTGTYIRDYYFGGGHRVRSPHLSNINFFAPSGYPTAIDTIGSDFTINAGRGTGNGRGGSVIFRTSPATSSGTTLQTLQNRLTINNQGNVLINRDTSYVGIAQTAVPRLDVNGDVNVSGILNFSPSTNDNQIKITSNRLLVGGASTQQGLIAIGSYSAAGLTSSGGNGLVALGGSAGFDLTSGGRYSIMIGRAAGRGITTGVNNTIISSGDALNIPSSTSNAIHLVAGGGYDANNADTTLLGLTGRYAFIGGGFDGTAYINDFYLGAGHRVRRPDLANLNFFAPSGYPTAVDTIGSNFTINAGRGTGAGVGGSVIFRTSSSTTPGTTLQTLTERVRISHRGNLLVGTATDDTSSLVNIVSTTKGFLQPRMTNTQRDSIATPATGLQLFSTTDSANYVYRGTGGGWQKIANEISGSATLDFPSTNNGNKSDLTITVTGATEGDVVSLGIQNSVNLNHSCFTAWVSATDTVTVRFSNYGTGSLDPASATFKVKVFK